MFAHQTKNQPVSKETQDLLKLMMKESKLTNLQQRQLDKQMKAGKSLPKTLPSTYRTNKSRASKSDFAENEGNSSRKVQNSMTGSSISGYQLRRKEAIEKSGAYEIDQY